MQRVGIVIPVYHNNELHYDFTKQTVESIQVNHPEIKDSRIYLIVNYSRPEYYPPQFLSPKIPLTITDNPKGNQVGSAWNLGIRSALKAGFDYVVVCNNDLIFHKKAIDNLVEFANKHPEFILWTAGEWPDLRTIKTVEDSAFEDNFDEHPHFSCFMVNQKTIDTVGWIDENIKMGYFEDSDYHYRILLSGNKAGKTSKSRFYHYGSRTIKTDDDLYAINKRSYEDNRDYIKRKWNTDFHQKAYHPPEEILKEKDIYKFPFNDVNKTFKTW